VSNQLRAVLWNYIYEELQETADKDTWTFIGEPWRTVLRNVQVYFFHKPADELTTSFEEAASAVKAVLMRGDYLLVYGWLQHVLRLRAISGFEKRIKEILIYCRSPYRVVASDVIAPIGTDQDAAVITKGLADLSLTGLSGGREHLKTAAERLGAGYFADSVRESIHAVESVVRVLEPDGDFSRALTKLEAKQHSRRPETWLYGNLRLYQRRARHTPCAPGQGCTKSR